MRIQLIIFFTFVYMNTNTVFSQDFVNICVKRVELSEVHPNQEPQDEKVNCFDYNNNCLNLRDSLHLLKNNYDTRKCLYWHDEVIIKHDEHGTPETIIRKYENGKDSIVRLDKNEYISYLFYPDSSMNFAGKYIFTDSLIEIYAPITISWWGSGPTDEYFDDQNYLYQSYKFSNGYLIESFFKEVYKNGLNNNSLFQYKYHSIGTVTSVFIEETSSTSPKVRNELILISNETKERFSKLSLLSFLAIEFDVMYSSIFPLLLLNIPELMERHW